MMSFYIKIIDVYLIIGKPWKTYLGGKQWYISAESSFCILEFSKVAQMNLYYFYCKKVNLFSPILLFTSNLFTLLKCIP